MIPGRRSSCASASMPSREPSPRSLRRLPRRWYFTVGMASRWTRWQPSSVYRAAWSRSTWSMRCRSAGSISSGWIGRGAREAMSNEQIIDAAAEWFLTLRLAKPDAATQERFLQWLRASPEHVREYLAILSVWTDIPAMERGGEQSASAYIERALASNVVELKDLVVLKGPVAPPFGKARRRRWWVGGAIAAACVAVSLLIAFSDTLYRSDAG